MFTLVFWKAALERAVRTFAQAALGVLGAGFTGVLQVDWVNFLSVAGLAALVSVLTSLATAGVQGNGPGVFEKPVQK